MTNEERLLEVVEKIDAALPSHRQVEAIGTSAILGLGLLAIITVLLAALLWRLW